MDEESMAALCRFEFFKGSGPGGQKRNKTSSAVRVTLPEFGLCAEDCTERSQHRNRANALKKLKRLLAWECPVFPALPPALPECSLHSPLYPLMLAHHFDLLAESNWDYRIAAEKCGCAPSKLLKILFRDPEAWQVFQQKREAAGLPRLLPPRH